MHARVLRKTESAARMDRLGSDDIRDLGQKMFWKVCSEGMDKEAEGEKETSMSSVCRGDAKKETKSETTK